MHYRQFLTPKSNEKVTIRIEGTIETRRGKKKKKKEPLEQRRRLHKGGKTAKQPLGWWSSHA